MSVFTGAIVLILGLLFDFIANEIPTTFINDMLAYIPSCSGSNASQCGEQYYKIVPYFVIVAVAGIIAAIPI